MRPREELAYELRAERAAAEDAETRRTLSAYLSILDGLTRLQEFREEARRTVEADGSIAGLPPRLRAEIERLADDECLLDADIAAAVADRDVRGGRSADLMARLADITERQSRLARRIRQADARGIKAPGPRHAGDLNRNPFFLT